MLALTRVVMNPGDSRTSDRLLPHPRGHLVHRVERRGRGLERLHDLDELHLVHGLKKCMPATRDGLASVAASSVRLSADVFEATIACCRRQALDVGKELELEIDSFRRRLDDEVGIGDGLRQVGGCSQPAENRAGVISRDLPALDAASDDLLDRPSSPLDGVRRHVEHDRVVAGGRGGMCDPVAHRPGSEHRNPSNHHLVFSEGLCPSDSPTRSIARRFAGALRSRDSLAALARTAQPPGRFMR